MVNVETTTIISPFHLDKGDLIAVLKDDKYHFNIVVEALNDCVKVVAATYNGNNPKSKSVFYGQIHHVYKVNKVIKTIEFVSKNK